jgi:hypothetical protein
LAPSPAWPAGSGTLCAAVQHVNSKCKQTESLRCQRFPFIARTRPVHAAISR